MFSPAAAGLPLLLFCVLRAADGPGTAYNLPGV